MQNTPSHKDNAVWNPRTGATNRAHVPASSGDVPIKHVVNACAKSSKDWVWGEHCQVVQWKWVKLIN